MRMEGLSVEVLSFILDWRVFLWKHSPFMWDPFFLLEARIFFHSIPNEKVVSYEKMSL